MQFRRSGQRDERRRRVFSDTVWHDDVTDRGPRRTLADEEPPARKARNYGDAAFMDDEPRLTDLIPTNLAVFAGLALAGLAVVAGLESLYTWMPQLAPLTTDGRVAAFDLDGEGSLAVWFSSMTLAAAGLVAILVYRVRRYRTDDYHGRYRIWLWAAACWFLLSLDETASLHEGFKEMMAQVTGTRLLGDGSIWWVTAYVFLLGAVGARLVVDMRECALSTVVIVLAAVSYAVAVAAQLGLVLPESGVLGIMLEEGAEMVGNLMLLLAMGLHARHVILDARGLLPERQTRQARRTPASWRRRQREEPSEDPLLADTRPVTVHPPHGVSRPAAASLLATELQAEQRALTVDEPAETPQAPTSRKLTKAERKALRKRLRQMAMERQRREAGG